MYHISTQNTLYKPLRNEQLLAQSVKVSTSLSLYGEIMASSIKTLSECPVCFGEMFSPMKIFQCINGHSICEDFKDNVYVTSCPSCRVTLKGVQMTRNILAEPFIEAA